MAIEPNAARRSVRDRHIIPPPSPDSPKSWTGDGKLCIDHDDDEDNDDD